LVKEREKAFMDILFSKEQFAAATRLISGRIEFIKPVKRVCARCFLERLGASYELGE
jgi:hypothetical protein